MLPKRVYETFEFTYQNVFRVGVLETFIEGVAINRLCEENEIKKLLYKSIYKGRIKVVMLPKRVMKQLSLRTGMSSGLKPSEVSLMLSLLIDFCEENEIKKLLYKSIYVGRIVTLLLPCSVQRLPVPTGVPFPRRKS